MRVIIDSRASGTLPTLHDVCRVAVSLEWMREKPYLKKESTDNWEILWYDEKNEGKLLKLYTNTGSQRQKKFDWNQFL